MDWKKNILLEWLITIGLGAFPFIIWYLIINNLYTDDIFDLPEPLILLIAFLPLLVLYALYFYVLFYLLDNVFSQKTRKDRSSMQLKNLNKARKTLAASLKYLDKLSGTIQDSQKKQKELSLLVESLSEASKETASDLKKKLAAIGFINRRKEYLRFALGFALGVIASLLASAIWSLLSTK